MHIRAEHEIMKSWVGDIDKPMVSICCTTYNHELYIAEAIEGFLMQKTDFPFEILIRDDCSTDKTAEIVKQYVHQYPQLIKPIYEKENTFSKGVPPMAQLYKIAKGSYIATCEGDDYWTDPLKLHKQVGFLEKNKDYIISGHDNFIVDENGKQIKDSQLSDDQKRDFSGKDLILCKVYLLTVSWVFRNQFPLQIPVEHNSVWNGDTFVLSLLGHYGKSKYHDDIKPAAYRKHNQGMWSSLSEYERDDRSLNTFLWMYRYYKRIGKKMYATYFFMKYQKRLMIIFKYKLTTKFLNIFS